MERERKKMLAGELDEGRDTYQIKSQVILRIYKKRHTLSWILMVLLLPTCYSVTIQ